MPAWTELIIIHAGATWFMTGLIWFVQIVHYPLMARVGRENWIDYEASHQRRTTCVVGPVMLVEAVAATLVLVLAVSGGVGGEASASLAILAWTGAGLLALVWISTFLIQVPIHRRLSREFEDRFHRRLVNTNWIRTVLWSARAVVAGWMFF